MSPDTSIHQHFPTQDNIYTNTNLTLTRKPPPPIPIKYQTYVVTWYSWMYIIFPSGKKSRTFATMQQVARGMRANPRDLAKPREHIFTRSGEKETVIRDGELGWWTEEWRDFKRPPPPLPHVPKSRRRRQETAWHYTVWPQTLRQTIWPGHCGGLCFPTKLVIL